MAANLSLVHKSRPRIRAASLTSSPLASPPGPIYALANRFQDHLYFPDPSPLYALMGAVAGNMLPGNPVWLMMVGPPSCGKTELLNALSDIPNTHLSSSLRTISALLSGVAKRDRSKHATGGLLRQIGDGGAIVLKDFTSMLSLPIDVLSEMLGAFREIYDGRWSREIGGEGGLKLNWEGRVAMFAACTQAIDHHHHISHEMGERWVFFRYPQSDGWGESRAALMVKDVQAMRQELREAVAMFFEGMLMDWQNASGIVKRTLEQWEIIRLVALATVSARCRSGIVRNRYNKDIEDSPQAESPARLATVLGQLYLGMEATGLENKESWRVLKKIAMDSMPQSRRRVLDVLLRTNGHAYVDSTLEEINQSVKVSTPVLRRVLEDMEMHDIIIKTQGKRLWRLSGWMEREVSQIG